MSRNFNSFWKIDLFYTLEKYEFKLMLSLVFVYNKIFFNVVQFNQYYFVII